VAEHAGDSVALVAGYEQLRERVLCGEPDGWRLGHGVLATRGMAAWMGAWRALAPAPAPERSALFTGSGSCPAPGRASVAICSLPRASEIVGVLSEMTLAHAA
jgi:hypothetical protein